MAKITRKDIEGVLQRKVDYHAVKKGMFAFCALPFVFLTVWVMMLFTDNSSDGEYDFLYYLIPLAGLLLLVQIIWTVIWNRKKDDIFIKQQALAFYSLLFYILLFIAFAFVLVFDSTYFYLLVSGTFLVSIIMIFFTRKIIKKGYYRLPGKENKGNPVAVAYIQAMTVPLIFTMGQLMQRSSVNTQHIIGLIIITIAVLFFSAIVGYMGTLQFYAKKLSNKSK